MIEWETLRKKIPYKYWLFYDTVIGFFLLLGLYYTLVFIVPFLFFLVALGLDVIEFITKRRAKNWKGI